MIKGEIMQLLFEPESVTKIMLSLHRSQRLRLFSVFNLTCFLLWNILLSAYLHLHMYIVVEGHPRTFPIWSCWSLMSRECVHACKTKGFNTHTWSKFQKRLRPCKSVCGWMSSWTRCQSCVGVYGSFHDKWKRMTFDSSANRRSPQCVGLVWQRRWTTVYMDLEQGEGNRTSHRKKAKKKQLVYSETQTPRHHEDPDSPLPLHSAVSVLVHGR